MFFKQDFPYNANKSPFLDLAKRLTEKQKKEIIQGFKDGKSIDLLHKEFDCTKLTIIRNLKIILGEQTYKKLLIDTKKKNFKETYDKSLKNKDLFPESTNKEYSEIQNTNKIISEKDFYPDSSFLEISPLDYEIDNFPQKDLSSVPIEEIEFPKTVYMIVDKKIELEIKLLKDFPTWGFLPEDDLNRKTIEIYFDLKLAKRFCNKEQKVIKVPNTNVFKIAAPFLISKGISRIVSDDLLIAL